VAPILGIVALRKIKRSNGLLAGKGLARTGITISVFFIVLGFILPSMGRVGPLTYRINCMARMHNIGRAINYYAEENDGKYPTPNKWCDLLKKYVVEPERTFVCPSAGDGRYHYAMNPNCEPNSPPDMVLLFETKGGWNQFGGPEILTFENHRGKGCNILFNDGRIEFVKPEELGKLKWKVEEGNSVE
jgi:hypothetical protein